jgi:hypothetical protein
VHEAKAPASSEQVNVDSASVAPNEKLALETLASTGGKVSIVVLGAVVSTVHVVLATLASALPAASVARTAKVCVPSLRPA